MLMGNDLGELEQGLSGSDGLFSDKTGAGGSKVGVVERVSEEPGKKDCLLLRVHSLSLYFVSLSSSTVAVRFMVYAPI